MQSLSPACGFPNWPGCSCCPCDVPGLQTFSGPVRRRFGARSWGGVQLGHTDSTTDLGSGEQAHSPAAVSSPTATDPASSLLHKRGKGLLGSAAGKWEGRPAGPPGSPGVTRIDEGEGGEEL